MQAGRHHGAVTLRGDLRFRAHCWERARDHAEDLTIETQHADAASRLTLGCKRTNAPADWHPSGSDQRMTTVNSRRTHQRVQFFFTGALGLFLALASAEAAAAPGANTNASAAKGGKSETAD